MKYTIIFIVSLYSFIATGQDIHNFKTFNSLLENPIDITDAELKRNGYTYYVQSENWMTTYRNKDTNTSFNFQIYPKLGVFVTQDRTLYLKMVESILENKLVQVPKNMEIKSAFLGYLDGRICYKGLGYYYVSQEARYDNISYYSIYFGKVENWMKLVAYDKLPEKGVNSTATENSSSSDDYALERYTKALEETMSKEKKEEERRERAENKEKFEYWGMHIGMLIPIGTLNDLTPQSKGYLDPYKNGQTFGAKYGIQIGYSGIASPKALNSTFPNFFNFSLACKFDYSSMGLDHNKRDSSNIPFEYKSLGRFSGGVGPALTFGDPSIGYGISFYYLPQISIAFGGGFNSYDDKIELTREKVTDFSYLGSFGFAAVFDKFQIGLEYSKYLENSIFTYSDDNIPNSKPTSFNANILVKQVIFKIGYTFSEW